MPCMSSHLEVTYSSQPLAVAEGRHPIRAQEQQSLGNDQRPCIDTAAELNSLHVFLGGMNGILSPQLRDR
jgi:hypothetical protein